MSKFTLRRYRTKLAGFSFGLLIVCLLVSTGITFLMCAGYVDSELFMRQKALMSTALDLYHEAGLTPDGVANLLSGADYLVHPANGDELSETDHLKIKNGEFASAGPFMGRILYFDLGGTLMSIEAYPASNLIVSTILRSLLGNLIVIVLGYIAVHLSSRRLTLPIVHLTEATRKVAKGNFDIHVELHEPRLGTGIREVAELADNFNRMAHELKGVEYLRRDFTSNLSHELKSPVASIRGYARLLQMEGITPQQRRDYVNLIANESQRLGCLSDNLLRLTRLEGQPRRLACEAYDLDEQLRRCVTARYPEIQKKNISILADLPRLQIKADPDLLIQVWQNLLDNAIKFAPENGHILLKLEKTTRNHVRVSIEDNGPGMDEATQARIFEKFFQGDPSRHIGGNGLGLPLVKRIVDLCGGHIEVTSHPGSGSIFSVILPIRPFNESEKEAIPQ